MTTRFLPRESSLLEISGSRRLVGGTFKCVIGYSISYRRYEMFGMRRRGWLRPWILSMLEEGPKNGADIINEVEKASMGWWRPSPGSVYPLLEEMMQDGLVTRREDGKYEITNKGKDEMSWTHGPWRRSQRPVTVDAMLSEVESILSYFEDVVRSDRSKISGQAQRIKAIKERFSSLTEMLSSPA